MTRVLLTVILIAAPLASEAQPTGTVPRIGMLCATFCASSTFLLPEHRVFLEALRGLGWVDGQTVLVDDRAAGVGFARLGEAATELVRLKAAVILATDGAAAQAARHVTLSYGPDLDAMIRARPPTSTRSSKAPHLATCPSSSRRSSS